MTSQPRYAVYFMPCADSPLWQFGSRVLGYDAADPAGTPQPFDELRDAAAAGAFAEPARYGFHATLKAPFELAAGADEADLLAAAAAFSARKRAFGIGQIAVAQLDRFVALTAVDRSNELHDFADRCVTEFEVFRAPLSIADRERRLRSRLSAAAIANLDHWGYPQVFDLFLFHMTLSGPLEPDRRAPLHALLEQLYAPVKSDVIIDGIAIFKQAARTTKFHVLRRFALGT